jgi:indolepyruvate ferredoxin oxidoreductase alpha subunit
MAGETVRDVQLLLGNEAIALGAYHAGVHVATGYPGTPSTEVLEYLARIAPADVYVEWSTNEKVALDVGIGAALGGARVLVTMKHVGLNVAMDSWMTSAFVGVNGGLVVLSADDPGMHSSQNEQDNRYLARTAGVPLFEPANSQEAYEFTRAALQVSEEWDTPCLLRTTTRIAHSRSRTIVAPRDTVVPRRFQRQPEKYVMLPANARRRRLAHVQRLERLASWVETHPFNREEMRSPAIGVITSGVSYHYVREVLPDASTLKLGISFPLPQQKMREFAAKVKRLFVVEELEPYLEEEALRLGLAVEGKRWFPRVGELSPEVVRRGFQAAGVLPPAPAAPSFPSLSGPAQHEGVRRRDLPATVVRPPVLCAGCPHATPYLVLRELDAIVMGDIGCYTLAAGEPLRAMDSCLAMGSSIGMAIGLAKAGPHTRPIVATIGDSTFLHSGLPALVDAVYSRVDITVVILDNGTTAMTGGQPHPASGATIRGEPAPRVNIPELCRAIGVDSVVVVDPYDLGATHRALLLATRSRGVSVVITNRPCVEAPVKSRGRLYRVEATRCDGCQLCMNLGCPAIVWDTESPAERRVVRIDSTLCTGCTVCAQMCPQSAIHAVDLAATMGSGG